MARGLPRRVGSFCCSIEANAQFRSMTRVVGSAVLRPSSIASLEGGGTASKCSHQPEAAASPTAPVRPMIVVLPSRVVGEGLMRASRMLMAVDLHAEGEPGRVILGGIPDVPGRTMFEKRLYFEQHLDGVRKLMLREPRGYPGLCCNVVLPPTDPLAAAGFVIMEQTEYPPMSGSNIICTATALLEMGVVPATEPTTRFMLEAPAGLVGITAVVENGRCRSITFENLPAFAVHLS